MSSRFHVCENSLEIRASISNQTVIGSSSRRKLAENAEEIRRLDERLRILEEESEMLKKTLLESLEERSRLKTEERIGPAGLLQKFCGRSTLWQEHNPSVVTRHLRHKDISIGFK